MLKIMNMTAEIYLENLVEDTEYSWIDNDTLRTIIQIIIAASIENETVQAYHAILWICQNVFLHLIPIWQIVENDKSELYPKYLK